MKYQIRLFTSLILALAGLPAQAFSAPTQLPLTQCNLTLILDLDDTEGQEGLNANQVELSNHIAAKEACIVTSACTLQHMVNAAHKINIDKDDSLIENAAKAYAQLDSFELYTNGSFWLLLPATIAAAYKAELAFQHANLKPSAKPKPIRARSKTNNDQSDTQELLRSQMAPLLSFLKSTFKKNDHSTWNIYATGHGDAHGKVCGMADAGLKSLLDFFATEMNTRTLTYSSCYGGGQVTDFLVADSAKYPYLILCQGLGENVLFAITQQNTPTIFSNVSRIKDTRNIQEVIACLPRRSELADHESYCLYNSYQILLPDSSAFIVPEVQDSIGSTTILINQTTDDATLQNPADKDLILDTTYLARPICLRDTFELYSRVKGHARHYLAYIDASTLDKAAFIEKLYNFSKANLHVKQIFLIKKVELKDGNLENCMVFINCPKPAVCGSTERARFCAFYQQQGHGWIDLQTEQIQLSKEETQTFLNQFDDLHGQIKANNHPQRFMYVQACLPMNAIQLAFALFAALHVAACTIYLITRRRYKAASID